MGNLAINKAAKWFGSHKSSQIIVPLVCSISVFLVAVSLTRLSVSILLALALGICAFSLHAILNKSKDSFLRFSLPFPARLGIIGLCFISLISMAFGAVSTTIFVSWDSVNVQALLQFIAVVFLTNFFPGYVFLKLILSGSKISLTGIIVFSFLISTFSLSIIGVSLAFLGFQLQILCRTVTILLNAILLAIYIIYEFKNKRRSSRTEISLSHNQLLMISVIGFFIVAIFSVYFSVLSSPRSDDFLHIADASKILRGSYPWDLTGNISSPFLFYFYLASFFSVSSLPIINSYVLLMPFIIMLPLAFYLMLQSFRQLPKKVPAIAAAFFGLSSGVGWVYTAYLQSTNSGINSTTWYNLIEVSQDKTLADTVYGSYGLSIWGLQPMVISLTIFLTLIYLVRSENLSRRFVSFMIVSIVCYGYLTHVAEIVIFIVVALSSFVILYKRSCMSDLRRHFFFISVGLVLSCLIVLIVNTRTNGNIARYSTSIAYTVAFVVFLTAITFLKERLTLSYPTAFFTRFGFLKEHLRWPSLFLLIYVLGLSFIIWSEIYPIFHSSYVSSFGVVPWYFYPLRLGIIGVMGLLTIWYLAFRRRFLTSDLVFFVILTILAFSVGRLISFVNVNIFFSNYWEQRILTFSFIGLVVLASFSCLMIFQKFSKMRLRIRVFSSLLLALIILSSVMSTLYSTELWTLRNQASNEDYDALNFLNSRDFNASPIGSFPVLAVSDRSNRFVSMVGVSAYPFSDFLFEQSSPEVFFSITSAFNTQYLYLPKADRQTLSTNFPSSFLTKYLLDYLPSAYENKGVIIKAVPYFSVSQPISNLAVLTPAEPSNRDYFIIEAAALGRLNYSLLDEKDPELFVARQMILTQDVEVPWEDTTFKSGWRFDDGMNYSSDGTVLNISLDNSMQPSVIAPTADVTFDSVEVDPETMLFTVDMQVNLGTNDFVGIMYYDSEKTEWNGLGSIYPSGGTKPGWASPVAVENDRWIELSFELKPGITKIGGIRLYFATQGGSSHSFSLRRAVISSYKYLSFQGEKILEWVEDGGHLFVFDSQNKGLFTNLLNIKHSGETMADSIDGKFSLPETMLQTTNSKDANVTIERNYTYRGNPVTPFAYTKVIGKGKLTYVEVAPYLSSMELAKPELKSNLFENLPLILMSLDEFDREATPPTRYPIMANLGNFSGVVRLETNVFFLTNESEVLWDQVKVSASSVFVDGKLTDDLFLENVFLTGIDTYGESESTIKTTIMQIALDGKGYYVPLSFEEGLNWTLNLDENAALNFQASNGSNATEIKVQGGVIELSAKNPLTATAKTPKIFVSGEACFSYAYFWAPYDWISCSGMPITLKGDIYLRSGLSGSGTVLYSNFSFDGSTEVSNLPTASLWNEWNIPWLDILLSPYNLVLILFVLICLQQIYIMRAKNLFKIKSQE